MFFYYSFIYQEKVFLTPSLGFCRESDKKCDKSPVTALIELSLVTLVTHLSFVFRCDKFFMKVTDDETTDVWCQ